MNIDGDSIELMQSSFLLDKNKHHLLVKSYGYLTKDTTIQLNYSGEVFRIPMERDPAYIVYERNLNAYKLKKKNQVWVPVSLASTGFAISSALFINASRYKSRKQKLEREYAQTGPDILSIENVKKRFENLKTSTKIQWRIAVVTASISAVSSVLVAKKMKEFNKNNKKPIYLGAPELSLEIIDSEIFMGLTYKIQF